MRRLLLLASVLAAAFTSTNGAAAGPDAEAPGEMPADITLMKAFNVQADRLEDFGFRVSGFLGSPFATAFPVVSAVWPNTAASKAGLKPGDRILKTDGKSAGVTLLSLSKWHTLQKKKWAEVAAGKKSVTWELEIESDAKQLRTLKLVVPTGPPRWGASTWQPPESRAPVSTIEPGPLAARSRTILENGVWSLLDQRLAAALGLVAAGEIRHRDPFVSPVLGYEWHFTAANIRHRIFVTQSGGRTHIMLEVRSPAAGLHRFLTSPSGALERALHDPPKGGSRPEMLPDFGVRAPVSLEAARPAFAAALEFWLTKVGKVSARWPLELLPGVATEPAAVAFAGPKSTLAATLPPQFLHLPAATPEQQQLFRDACGRLGADADRWAYTETARGLDNKFVFATRFDPSKPEAARCTLLTVNGKPPKPADLERWREEGRDTPATLGALPPLEELVDVNDVRVHADEPAAIVFELPLRAGGGQFSAENFQALFRVNKTARTFEDIAVRLREALRVAGVAKLTDAGLEVRFRRLDSALAPQPVYLKAGGAARVLLVKFSRAIEATRSDFQRVEPYEERAAPPE